MSVVNLFLYTTKDGISLEGPIQQYVLPVLDRVFQTYMAIGCKSEFLKEYKKCKLLVKRKTKWLKDDFIRFCVQLSRFNPGYTPLLRQFDEYFSTACFVPTIRQLKLLMKLKGKAIPVCVDLVEQKLDSAQFTTKLQQCLLGIASDTPKGILVAAKLFNESLNSFDVSKLTSNQRKEFTNLLGELHGKLQKIRKLL